MCMYLYVFKRNCFFLFFITLSGVRLSPLVTTAPTGLLYDQPQMMMVIVEQLVK
jgi:hypothetical protein